MANNKVVLDVDGIAAKSNDEYWDNSGDYIFGGYYLTKMPTADEQEGIFEKNDREDWSLTRKDMTIETMGIKNRSRRKHNKKGV